MRPARPRDAARLLVVRPGGAPELEDRTARDLPDLLEPGDALVFNDARVIPAELKGLRERGGAQAKVSFNLHRRVGADRWLAFARPAKRLAAGDRVVFGEGAFAAAVLEKGEKGEVLLGFDRAGPDLDAAIAAAGALPLPPYIAQKRPADEADRTDYQTIFARAEGAVAAPTAGLHFTPELLDRLRGRGVSLHFVTLHVGAGTFLPMKAETVEEHRMHAEWGEVSAETASALAAVRAGGGRVVAVGTTALRLLETAAQGDGVLKAFAGETRLFITPGYRFSAADALMTNFHLPRSTLFMLVAAFCGLDRMRRAYAHAIEKEYRFYSYGDASLLMRD